MGPAEKTEHLFAAITQMIHAEIKWKEDRISTDEYYKTRDTARHLIGQIFKEDK